MSIDSLFASLDVALAILSVVAAVGFLRLLWPESLAQLPGTILIIAMAALAVILMGALNSQG